MGVYFFVLLSLCVIVYGDYLAVTVHVITALPEWLKSERRKRCGNILVMPLLCNTPQDMQVFCKRIKTCSGRMRSVRSGTICVFFCGGCAGGGVCVWGLKTNIPANEHHVDSHVIVSSCSRTKIQLQGPSMPTVWWCTSSERNPFVNAGFRFLSQVKDGKYTCRFKYGCKRISVIHGKLVSLLLPIS